MDVLTLNLTSLRKLSSLNVDIQHIVNLYLQKKENYRTKLIYACVPIAINEAKRYLGFCRARKIQIADIFQEALTGLIIGIDTWDGQNSVIEYATRCIHNEIKMFLYREGNRGIRLPANKTLRHYLKIQRMAEINNTSKVRQQLEYFLQNRKLYSNIGTVNEFIPQRAEEDDLKKCLKDVEDLLIFLDDRDSTIIKRRYGLCNFKIQQPSELKKKFNIEYYDIQRAIRKLKKVARKGVYCMTCDKPFLKKRKEQKYCCHQCSKGNVTTLKLGNGEIKINVSEKEIQ